MKLLALDTSSAACSVAAQVDDHCHVRHEVQPRKHTQLLLPMLREVIEASGVALRDFDAIVLGNGPGSFIGMRIAASVAQGLAHAAELKIVPVSSLAAIAAEVFATSEHRYAAVAQDAHMSEVYLGVFARGENGAVQVVEDEQLQSSTAVLSLPDGCVPGGQGWFQYPELLAANAAQLKPPTEVLYPHARYLMALADMQDAIAPALVEPAYLRQKVAERPATPGT